MEDKQTMALKNIDTMNKLDGFDVVIICCSSSKQAEYWQQRLEKGKGSILSSKATVFAVEEDWPGGAGNGKKQQQIVLVNIFF
jgi:aspartate-semialdehyde dehydrogenase